MAPSLSEDGVCVNCSLSEPSSESHSDPDCYLKRYARDHGVRLRTW